MEVEVANYGSLEDDSFSLAQLTKEENLPKYIAMIALAVEYLENLGLNHGNVNFKHIYLFKNEENGEITLKLSNIRSQMLLKE
jgi:hypothetical protein